MCLPLFISTSIFSQTPAQNPISENPVLADIVTLETSISAIADEQCDQSSKVAFETNDIFDLTEADTKIFHRWANALHYNTLPSTLANESAFFLKKCDITEQDLHELERHLRGQSYLRDALVTQDSDGQMLVKTWDNWSLTPTLDYGRKGGVNEYAIGIKDHNLLGLGIDADFEYFTNEQRSGYKVHIISPLYLGENINTDVRLTDNDDGSSQAVFVIKNFVSFDTPYAYKIGFDNFRQIDTLRQNGRQVAQFNHKKSHQILHWEKLYADTEYSTLRYGLGFTHEEHLFYHNEVGDQSVPGFGVLPQDRELSYPFASAEYVQKDYRELRNFNLINQIEDFNLGWHGIVLVGSDISSPVNKSEPNTSQNLPSASLIYRASLSKGIEIGGSGFLFLNAHAEGERYDGTTAANRSLFRFSSEYFHTFNSYWGGYIKNENVVSNNQFVDSPIAIGGESGVRGYPLQYQHGANTSQLTIEARFYPRINLYKFFELGAAAFVDIGKAYGDSAITSNSPNSNSSTLASVGIGARLYSTHSSEAQVIHFDLIKPLSSDTNVSNFEFRVTTKHSF
jgi:hypothetical protein